MSVAKRLKQRRFLRRDHPIGMDEMSRHCQRGFLLPWRQDRDRFSDQTMHSTGAQQRVSKVSNRSPISASDRPL